MSFPAFYADVRKIVMRDPLAGVLGAASDGGVMEYCYADAVKLSGHSCPTVASSFIMAAKGLAHLYPGETPLRGGVGVEIREPELEGVTGVLARVFSLVTGAAGQDGFKGLGGQFNRRGLLRFGADHIGGQVRLVRTDTGRAVDLGYHPEAMPQASPRQLMGRVLSGEASAEEAREFGEMWQGRVKLILIDLADDPALVSVDDAGVVAWA
jgi:hypothetical protein